MGRGDHIFVWRQHNGVPYQHHAIDIGDGLVVHFSDGAGGIARPGTAVEDFQIQRASRDSITRGGRDSVHVVSHSRRLPADEIVLRAESQLGRTGYHLLFDNCEHFANWCVVDRRESRQVSIACERIGAAGAKLAAIGSVRASVKVGAKSFVRGVSPWLLISDAAQWITEVGGHHIGLRDPHRREQAGKAVGATTSSSSGSQRVARRLSSCFSSIATQMATGSSTSREP